MRYFTDKRFTTGICDRRLGEGEYFIYVLGLTNSSYLICREYSN